MRHQRLNDEKTLQSHRGDGHTTGVGPAASRCLSEDEVMRLCAGEIAEEHLPRVDEHLDRCEACQRWVAEVMAHGETTPAQEDTSLHPGAFRAGTVAAGRFRIARFIKRGGMGEVYEAYDSVLETRVALKTILSTACDNPRAVRKLKAEVQLARSIRHPNVCSVFDIWEHRSNQGEGSAVFFFTMEFIEGVTLRQLLEHSQFELDETLRIARLQLLGLRAAHDSGVVHRDFKSDNVMMRAGRHDDSQVVVMDFGLARTLQNEGASNDSEQFAGSVAYMAPEQVEGRRHIGPEADVFAFGVVLFEMLTGELPWVGDSPWTTAALRLTQRAPAPSKLHPGLPPRVDAFVLKCLNREPAERFKDAREALIFFDELLCPPPRRARRWVGVALAGLAGLVVALGVQRTSSSVSALQPASDEVAAASTPSESASGATSPPPTLTTPAPAPAAAANVVPSAVPAMEATPPPPPLAPPPETETSATLEAAATPKAAATSEAASPPAARPTEGPHKSRSRRSDASSRDERHAPSAKASSPSHARAPMPIPAPIRAFEPTPSDAASASNEATPPSERAPGAPTKLRDFE